MKKIGFIDYYISEWHANNYPTWIREVIAETGDEVELAYAWAELDVSPVDGRNTDTWCKDYGVQKCDSIQELCEKSDYILILSPSNPEKHLGYAKEALKYGKNTYIDKTFTPNYAEAKEIFAIAEKYNTKFFSSSALRYADELKGLEAKSVVVMGGGGSLEEYIIHQVEMLVKLMDVGADKVKVTASAENYLCQVKYLDGREAALVYGSVMPFNVLVDKKDGTSVYHAICSHFFKNLLTDILHFFKTGEKSFDGAQTLEAMKIREALIEGKGNLGEWIEISKN